MSENQLLRNALHMKYHNLYLLSYTARVTNHGGCAGRLQIDAKCCLGNWRVLVRLRHRWGGNV